LVYCNIVWLNHIDNETLAIEVQENRVLRKVRVVGRSENERIARKQEIG